MKLNPQAIPTRSHAAATGLPIRRVAEYIRHNYRKEVEPQWVRRELGPRKPWHH